MDDDHRPAPFGLPSGFSSCCWVELPEGGAGTGESREEDDDEEEEDDDEDDEDEDEDEDEEEEPKISTLSLRCN